MPQGRDQTGNPDDLINELARLMAEDAKDTAPQAKNDEKPAARAQAPKPQPSSDPFEEGFRALHPGRGAGPSAEQSRSLSDPAPERSPTAPADTPSIVERRAQPNMQRPSSMSRFDFSERTEAKNPTPDVPDPSEGDDAAEPIDPIGALILQRETDHRVPQKQAEQRTEPSLFSKPTPRTSSGDRSGSDRFAVPPVFRQEDDAPALSSSGQPKPEASKQPGLEGRGVERSIEPAPRSTPADPLDEIEQILGASLAQSRQPKTFAPERHEPDWTAQTPAAARPRAAAPNKAAFHGDERRVEADVPPARNLESDRAADPASRFDDFAIHPGSAAGANVPNDDIVGAPVVPEHAGFTDDAQTVAAPPRRSRGPRLVLATLVVLLLAGSAGGVYWFLGMNDAATGPAPLLTANTVDAKVKPEPAAADEPSLRASVVDDLSTGTDSADEAIVSRDQSAGVDTTTVSRVIGDNGETGGLANRKVRTVTVRPDGTIVATDDSVAGNQVLSVDRPNVPAIPGESAANDTVDMASTFADEPVITEDPLPGNQRAPSAEASVESPSAVENAINTTAELGQGELVKNAPFPAPRLTRAAQPSTLRPSVPATTGSIGDNGAVDLINTVSEVATPTAPPSSSVPVVTGATAPAYVQLASQRSELAAKQTITVLQSQFSSQLSGKQLEVQKVDLADRGVFYRVRTPAESLEAANSLCSEIKSVGGDCFVRND